MMIRRRTTTAMMRMVPVITLMLLAAVPLAAADTTSVATSAFENCGGSVHLQIRSVSVLYYPNDPNGGAAGLVAISGNVTTDVEIVRGAAYVSASVLGRQIQLDHEDFCKMSKGGCPIAPGPFEVYKNISVDVAPPPGVEVQLRILVRNFDESLGCFNMRFDFDNKPFSLTVQAVGFALLIASLILGLVSGLTSVLQSLSQSSADGRASQLPPSQPHAAPDSQAYGYSYNAPTNGGSAPSGPSNLHAAHSGGAPSGPFNLNAAHSGGAPSGPSNFHSGHAGSAPSGPSNFHGASGSHPGGPGNLHGASGSAGPSGPGNLHSASGSGPAGPAEFHAAGHANAASGPGNLHGANGAGAVPANGPGNFHAGGGAVAPGPGQFNAAAGSGTVPSGPGQFNIAAGSGAGPQNFAPAQLAPGAQTGGAAHASAAAAAKAASEGANGAPFFFDIIHYFQFITLTGQLQLDYPSVFATFTRLFHFSNGGVKADFISQAAAYWTGVPASWNASDAYSPVIASNSTVQSSLANVISSEDVGVTAFVIQLGIQPANYFPITLITLLLMVAMFLFLSAIVSLVILIMGTSNLDSKGEEINHDDDEEDYDGALIPSKRGGTGRKSRLARVAKRKRAVLFRFNIANLLRAWMIAQYPLTVASCYWISHFAFTTVAPASVTTVAVMVFLIFCLATPATIILSILRTEPDVLFTDKRYLETLGPIYDQMRRDKVWFSVIMPMYWAIQGMIVGLFPRNSPRVLVETANTPQMIQAVFQPLLLIVVELIFIVLLFKSDPFADKFSGRMQWAVSITRLLVLIVVCTFAVPEYSRDLGSNPHPDDMLNNYRGGGVWTFKDVMGYIGALFHSLLVLSLLVFMLRRFYLWARAFYYSRRAASLASSSSGGSSVVGYASLPPSSDETVVNRSI